MELADIERFFLNCKKYVEQNTQHINFIWHGGEPFIIPLDNYREIKKLQDKIFSKDVVVSNGIQTNMTILTDKHIKFLKEEEFFDSVGISFDVYGDQRVDINNQLQTDLVLKNIQTIIENKISVGGISVLARNTFPYVKEIYSFYDELNIPIRFLPIYRSAFDTQVEQHALTVKEILVAMKMLLEAWSSSKSAVLVDPLDEYVNYAIAYMTKDENLKYFNKRDDEHTFILNKDGNLWGISETYNQEFLYGNMFSETFEEVIDSKGREKALIAAENRCEKFCKNCKYYGYCSGSFINNITPIEELSIEKEGCIIKLSIDLIIDFFQEHDIDTYIKNHLSQQTWDCFHT